MSDTEELPDCITPDELAKRLNVSRDHVYRMWRGGFLRGFKVGRRIVIPRTEVGRILTEMDEQVVRDLREFKGRAG